MRQIVLKIKSAIIPEDIRGKCLELVEKCHDEKILNFLNNLLDDYFDKRNKEVALILKNDQSLAAKVQKQLGKFEKENRDTDADDFLKSAKWE